MKSRWLITALLILTTGCGTQKQPLQASPQAASSTPEALMPVASSTPVAQNALPTVVSTGDGDTLRVRRSGKTITVRLACVDAPETAQAPWGQQAANRLKQLLPPGQAVQVREVDTDRYGRTVAELYLGNQSVNLTMVKEGSAIVYPQYIDNCAANKDQYLAAEAQAKAQQLGFWNQPNPVMPWDYRRGKRSNNQSSSGANPSPNPMTATSPSPTPTPTQTPQAGTPIRNSVQGSCQCPYDIDKRGRTCGARSAYSKPSGERPACYVGEP